MKPMQFSDEMAKSETVTPGVIKLLERASESGYGYVSSGINIIYTERGKSYEEGHLMRFGIEFSNFSSSSNVVVQLKNYRDHSAHSSHLRTTAKIVAQTERGSTNDLNRFDPPVTFKFVKGIIDCSVNSIEKEDALFDSLLNREAKTPLKEFKSKIEKQSFTAEKLDILLKVTDRMRTLYIYDLQKAEGLDIGIIPKILALLDKIAHEAEYELVAGLDTAKLRTDQS
jgi:hypothetical protein